MLRKDVVGIGSLNVDLLYAIQDVDGLNQALSKEELEPFESGRESVGTPEKLPSLLQVLERYGELKATSGGGSAANTAVSMSRMGFSTGFVGKVGNDESGRFLVREMEGVDTQGIVQGNGPSGICISVLLEGDRALRVFPNANDTLNHGDISFDYLAAAEFVHMTSFLGQVPFEAQKRIASELSAQTRISLDPGELYAKKGLEALLPIVERAYIVFATDREIEMMTDEGHEKGCEKLLQCGPHIIACKMGRKGCLVQTRNDRIEVPAPKTDVVDKTGAGDVFDAAFLSGLRLGKPLERCASVANRAAAESITGLGREKYPDASVLNNRS